VGNRRIAYFSADLVSALCSAAALQVISRMLLSPVALHAHHTRWFLIHVSNFLLSTYWRVLHLLMQTIHTTIHVAAVCYLVGLFAKLERVTGAAGLARRVHCLYENVFRMAEEVWVHGSALKRIALHKAVLGVLSTILGEVKASTSATQLRTGTIPNWMRAAYAFGTLQDIVTHSIHMTWAMFLILSLWM